MEVPGFAPSTAACKAAVLLTKLYPLEQTGKDSNLGHAVLETAALPTELPACVEGEDGIEPPTPGPSITARVTTRALPLSLFSLLSGGRWARTTDTLIFSQMLCQLSYSSCVTQPAGVEPASPDGQSGIITDILRLQLPLFWFLGRGVPTRTLPVRTVWPYVPPLSLAGLATGSSGRPPRNIHLDSRI